MYTNSESQSAEKPKRRPGRPVKPWTHSPNPHSLNDTMKSEQKKKSVLVNKNISFAGVVAVSKPHTKEVELKSMTLNGGKGHVVKRTIMTPDEIEGTVVIVSIVTAGCFVICMFW